ncbi:PEGA domain-containing protein [Brevundimonas sp. FT23028]|uniref:PEGA domain-containing protein n=1 Tax=Brevundimonas sp. FT23028 TaxID=3393748 RepID=UPI003B588193
MVALAVIAVSLPACASIIRGVDEDFRVESTPSGAQVSTTNGFECAATPCTFRMPRKSNFVATVSMDGYVTQEVSVVGRVSRDGIVTMAVGNGILGGGIGAAVDATSGAMRDLTPNPLVVELLTPAQEAERLSREAAEAAAEAADAAAQAADAVAAAEAAASDTVPAPQS